MNLVKNIAKNINKYRKVSIDKLSQKAGISKYTLQKLLYAQIKDVQISTLHKLASALNVKVDDLLK